MIPVKNLRPTTRQLWQSLLVACGIFVLPQGVRILFGEILLGPYSLVTDSWGMHSLAILAAYLGANILRNFAWAIALGMLAFHLTFGPLARFLERQTLASDICKTNYDLCGMQLMSLGAGCFVIAMSVAFMVPLILGILKVEPM